MGRRRIKKMETTAKQSEAKILAESGCYFFSIIEGCIRFARERMNAEITVDIFALFEKSVKNGWLAADCSVLNPDKIAGEILGKNVTTRHATLEEVPDENEIEITKYARRENGKGYEHFVLTRNNKVLYDSLDGSLTVKNGTRISKRILRVKL